MKRLLRTFPILLLLTIMAAPAGAMTNYKRCATCARDRRGRIRRGGAARREFMRRSGHPRGRRGYVVDHVVPLECGGEDSPSNMQWQTRREAREKDRHERDCRR